ncbi:thioredoxin [Methylocella silvestris BL2]|uniref:Thioredoxin n=1 Tax=Methylocella silvestris (strain DSM 15510 / CIP 108128 / LMG 27833 / NCIMB 13906 / BL2) TaxID=395965 RepID=B8ENM4_METSB|nr:thioredoxin [Methylocella silvestris]ACK50810.1 thioredoxin [Methylocella silvestris BL2]
MAGLYGLSANEAKPDQAAAASVVKDTTTASFGADVIAESARQPVLVDFWAPWCGPCKQLTPILEKVVQAAAGKVKLVKMNIDEHPEIAGRLGVRSIPAVIAFQRSQPVDGFMGALPESDVRGFVERLVGPIGGTADLLAEAEALVADGDPAAAAELFAEILAENPADFDALAGFVRLHVEAGDLELARELLDAAPAGAEKHAGVAAARAALELAEQAGALGDLADLKRKVDADPQDYQAAFDYAVGLNAHNRREEAAAALLDIIRRDRAWSEDGARKQLLQFFEAWGPADPATIGARKKLSTLLFS